MFWCFSPNHKYASWEKNIGDEKLHVNITLVTQIWKWPPSVYGCHISPHKLPDFTDREKATTLTETLTASSDSSTFLVTSVHILTAEGIFLHTQLISESVFSTVVAREGISVPDRGTSRCSKWVRDYPARSHKHWGCESAWQRSDASWSSCHSAWENTRADLWRRCSLTACFRERQAER